MWFRAVSLDVEAGALRRLVERPGNLRQTEGRISTHEERADEASRRPPRPRATPAPQPRRRSAARLARLALAGGTFVGRPFLAEERAGAEDMDRKEPRFSAKWDGFDQSSSSS